MAVTVSELSDHNTPADIWIVVDGKVWDVTEFAPQHPGGAASKFPRHPIVLLLRVLMCPPIHSHHQIRRP